jgi:hypothetical protein
MGQGAALRSGLSRSRASNTYIPNPKTVLTEEFHRPPQPATDGRGRIGFLRGFRRRSTTFHAAEAPNTACMHARVAASTQQKAARGPSTTATILYHKPKPFDGSSVETLKQIQYSKRGAAMTDRCQTYYTTLASRSGPKHFFATSIARLLRTRPHDGELFSRLVNKQTKQSCPPAVCSTA